MSGDEKHTKTVPTGKGISIGKATRPKAPKPGIYEESPEASRLVAIYTRVSTLEQAEGQSVEVQERLCREYIKRDKPGWKVVDVYRDEGASGKNTRRAGFQRMLQAIAEGKVNAIVCHHLDRFSRSLHDIMVYFKYFEDEKIYLSFADDKFDFSTPEGKMHFHILAVFADWYIENLSRETIKVKSSTVYQGRQNNQLPFGYQKNAEKEAIIVPEEAELLQEAFAMYATGNYTDRKIAEWINEQGFRTRKDRIWTKESVRTTLQLDFYYGVVKYKDDLYPGRHDPIIKQELFEQVQLVRKQHHRKPRTYSKRFKRVYLINGILKCASCGRNLRAQGGRKGYRYYREVSHMRGLECRDERKSVSADIPEEEIGKIITSFTLPENWREEIQQALDSQNIRKKIEKEIEKNKEKQRRLVEIYADGLITKIEYQKCRDNLKAEQEKLILPSSEKINNSGEEIESFKQVWELADMSERKEMCQLLFERIDYDMDKKRILRLYPKRGFSIFFDYHPYLETDEKGGYSVKRMV